jgi:tetratricopeptide (TPR) repeat protein
MMALSRSVAVLILVTIAAVAGAQTPPIGDRIAVSVSVAPSPTEQLRNCEELLAKAYDTSDEQEKLKAVLTVLANLDAVRKAWPNDTAAVVDAAVMHADVALEFNMPRNAVDAVSNVDQKASKKGYTKLTHRLGRAYEAMGKLPEAEQALLLAEKSLQSGKADLHESDEVLMTLAGFYARRNQPRNAMKRLAAAAKIPNQKPVRAALLRLEYLKHVVALHDDPIRSEARAAAQEVDVLLKRSRATARSASDSRQASADSAILATIERDLSQIKIEFGL